MKKPTVNAVILGAVIVAGTYQIIHLKKELREVGPQEASCLVNCEQTEELKNENTTLTNKNMEYAKEIERSQKKIKALRSTLDNKIADAETAKGEIKALRDDLNKAKNQLKDTHNDSHLEEALAENHELAQSLANLRDKYKTDINGLSGMVNALASRQTDKKVPIFTTKSDFEVHNALCAGAQNQLSKNIDKLWMSWKVKVVESNKSSLSAVTNNGYKIDALWGNKNAPYDLSPGDDIQLQFKIPSSQGCSNDFTAVNAIIAPFS